MNNKRIACLAAFIALMPTFSDNAHAQPDPEQLPKSAKMLYSYYGQQAQRYFFRLRNDDQPLRYQPQSLVNFTLEGNWFGSVFVWTKANRPLMVGCIGSGPEGDKQMVFNEFHLLTDKPLEPVRISGYRDWTWSPTGGPTPQPVEDAPAVAKSPASRLTQLRDIARQFAVEMKDGEEPWSLRLLPQPIYRFPQHQAAEQDGAIFAYLWTKGTDPELLLVLQSLPTKDGLRWHYQPVRFTWRSLSLKHRERDVWKVDEYREQWQTDDLKEPYVTVPITRLTLEEIEQEVRGNPEAKKE
jgi:hypothetical protein